MQPIVHAVIAISLLLTFALAFALLPYLRCSAGRTGRETRRAKAELDAQLTVPIGAFPPSGTAKISGAVQPPGSGLVAPVSGRSCVYWAVTLYSRTINPRLKYDTLHRLVHEERAVPFDLRDQSGAARIELGSRGTVAPSLGAMSQETRFPDVDVLRAQTLRRRTEDMTPDEEQQLLSMFGYPPGTVQRSVRSGFDTLLTNFAVEEVRIEPGERVTALGRGRRAGDASLVLAPAPDRRLLLTSDEATAGGYTGSEGLKLEGYRG